MGRLSNIGSGPGSDVGARPWWATKSWLALFFVVASVAGFIVGVFAPIVSQQKVNRDQRALEDGIAAKQRTLEQKIADSTRKVENLSRKVEVTRLLFDHYFGKSATQQTAVITYLRYQFPGDLSRKSLQAVLDSEARGKAKSALTRSVAAIKQVRGSKLDRAIAYERAGFEAVIARDLVRARTEFLKAYDAYPTYHNVDEIRHRVLDGRTVRRYSTGSPQERRRIVAGVVGALLTTYSWGIPTDLEPGLKRVSS